VPTLNHVSAASSPQPTEPWIYNLALAVAVQILEQLSDAERNARLEELASLFELWAQEGLHLVAGEHGFDLIETDFKTETVIDSSTDRSDVAAVAVGVIGGWPCDTATGRLAFDRFSGWLAEAVGGDDEPERWRRDILIGDLAALRPLHFGIKRDFGGQALAELGGPIDVR
jgi:hypothetical protein